MCIPYFDFPPVAVAARIISDMAGTFYALRRGAEGPGWKRAFTCDPVPRSRADWIRAIPHGGHARTERDRAAE